MKDRILETLRTLRQYAVDKGYELAILYHEEDSYLMRFANSAISLNTNEHLIRLEIIAHEGGVDPEMAGKLVQIAHRSRNLKGHGLDEGMSTRLLVYAAQLVNKGIEPQAACQMALVTPLTDDPDMRDTLSAAVGTYL